MSEPYRGPEDPHWYKDAIIYELHVRAFFDSDGDGIGDFRGLTEKLDYLEDLGVNTLWLLPFYPSPLKDDGYDISNYTGVHPSYGTLSDVKLFLREAHRRGLRVVTELILNHTSDQHPWFQRARRAPAGSGWRNWYVWSQTPELYKDVRVIFSDFEPSNWSWDSVAQAYYWHRFYAHQPDLNFDNPEVHQAILSAAEFWLAEGVDGFRLDAIPYLYERDGTTCENLPETHEFLRKLRSHIDAKYPNRLLLAEANQWPEDAVAYFGKGDECHMAFHFPIMTRLFLSLHMEDRYPMVDILAQTPALPDAGQWALFLRNHDELTLEMVTDQERDYMYRVYAQERMARINMGIRRRLAPLLQNNRRKIELLNALLFSLPGTPVLYYGDEIGMGDNIFLGDRNGVRTPMQWSGDRNAGFSRANAQRLYLPVNVDPEYHYEAVNVEAQQANPQSLLWWMKRLLALSRRFKSFGRGSIELLSPENRKVLAFLRRYQEEIILVVANLSRFSQYVEINLQGLKGRTVVELFGRTEFPTVGDAPYALTLGPHSFYWFALESSPETIRPSAAEEPFRTIEVAGGWTAAFSGKPQRALEGAILSYLKSCTWCSGGARPIRSLRMVEALPLTLEGCDSALALAQVDYEEGESETFSIPLSFVRGEAVEKLKKESPQEIVAALRVKGGELPMEGVLANSFADPSFVRGWLLPSGDGTTRRSQSAKISAVSPPGGESVRVTPEDTLQIAPDKSNPHHTTLALGNRFQFTWYRPVQDGLHPEIELQRFLAERSVVAPILPLLGHWEYSRKGRDSITLAVLRQIPPHYGNARTATRDELGRYFETVRSLPADPPLSGGEDLQWSSILASEIASEVKDMVGPFLVSVRKMGESTARLHQALLGDSEHPAFAPEKLSAAQRQSLFQGLRRKIVLVFQALRRALRTRNPSWTLPAERLLSLETAALQAAQDLLQSALGSIRIRGHGNLGLQHFLSTGSDFLISSVPAPTNGPFIERRLKRSPLWDVASMITSFRSTAQEALAEQVARGEGASDRWARLQKGAAAWVDGVVRTYVRGYVESLGDSRLQWTSVEKGDASLKLSLFEQGLDRLSLALLSRSDLDVATLHSLLDLLEGRATTRPKPDSSSGPARA